MSNHSIWNLFVVLLVNGMVVSSRASAPPAATMPTIGMPAGQEDDHAALRNIVPVYEQAVNEGKPELLNPYLDDEFSGVMVTGDSVDGAASLKAYWAKIQAMLGPGGTYHVAVHVAKPATLSGDLAIARGTTDDVVNAKGNEFHFNGEWTAVCRKSGGQWKLLRIESAMDPVTNEFVQHIVKRTSIIAAIIGGIIGLGVGAVVSIVLMNVCSKKPRTIAA